MEAFTRAHIQSALSHHVLSDQGLLAQDGDRDGPRNRHEAGVWAWRNGEQGLLQLHK